MFLMAISVSFVNFRTPVLLYSWLDLSSGRLLVADTKGQDNQGTHARISEVKNGVAVAIKVLTWLLLLGQSGCHGNCCIIDYTRKSNPRGICC